MDSARIAELLQPFLETDSTRAQRLATSDDVLFESISTYIDILLRWNSRINLTSIRTPEEIVTRHFGESLFAARHLFPLQAVPSSVSSAPSVLEGSDFLDGQPIHLADIGSGAGFPGIPIKLWAPHIALTLIESNQKKAVFLREVARGLMLTNIDIQNARAEALVPHTYDVVTLRAVERFSATLPVAAKLLRPRGRLALLISAAQLTVAHFALQNFFWGAPVPVPNSQSRLLILGQRSFELAHHDS